MWCLLEDWIFGLGLSNLNPKYISDIINLEINQMMKKYSIRIKIVAIIKQRS